MHGPLNVKLLAESAPPSVTKYLYCLSVFNDFGVMQSTDESCSRCQVSLKQDCTTDSAIT
jgi:hypothetical protein